MSKAGKFSMTVVATLMLVVAGTSPARAQETEERHEGIGIGIKGGWLFSKLSSEDIDFDNRRGQQIGIFLGGNRPGTVGVMAEINYGQRGAKFPGQDFDVDLNFVSVPVVVRVNGGARTLSGVSGYGIVGPQFDWLISREASLLGRDIDISDQTEGYELSLVVGGGVEITRFIVELRYIQGLRSIAKEFDLVNTDDLKSKSFGILFGFRFN
jgi:hypothetical protein